MGRLRNVAHSGDLRQVRSLLRDNSDYMNKYFKEEEDDEWTVKYTLLGWACERRMEKIVKYLLSQDDVDSSLGRKIRIFSDKYQRWEKNCYSPAILAVDKKDVHIAHLLYEAGCNVPEFFLQKHPPFPRTIVAPNCVKEHTLSKTLPQIDRNGIVEQLESGKLPLGWSTSTRLVEQIEKYNKSHAARPEKIKRLKEQYDSVNLQCEKVEAEYRALKTKLAALRSQREDIGYHISRAEAKEEMHVDLTDLLAFATRVEPIEAELVSKLEEELTKPKPILAALNDKDSQQPKLSLLLSSMKVDEEGIEATQHLNSTSFSTLTRETASPMCDDLMPSTVQDLLYTAEMMSMGQFQFSEHAYVCSVCLNHTPEQLVNYLRERDIDMEEDEVIDQDLNGRRILFCAEDEFEYIDQDDLDGLRRIHMEACQAQDD